MRDTSRGGQSIRWAGFTGAALIAAGVLLLRLEQRIRATGTVHAREEVHLYAPESATLARLHVVPGQSVKSGDPVATLDQPELRARSIQLEREQADLRAALDQNEVALLATNVLPDIEKEKLHLERRRLESAIALAESESRLCSNRLADLTLASPMAGTIVALDYRYEGMAVTQGARLAKVALLDGRYRIRALAPEKNIDLLQPGADALMKSGVFNAVLEGYVRGKVSRIHPEGIAAPSDTAPQYEVYVDVDSAPYPLELGSSVDVELRLGRRPLWGMLFHTTHRRSTP